MSEQLALTGRMKRWAAVEIVALLALFVVGLALRVTDLSAEGFADDEVHKWRATNNYANGIFVGDDIEHPMLMKWLMTASFLIGRQLDWAPETMIRLPNVIVGALTVVVVAILGRRILGPLAGLLGAAVVALSPTMIGYNRVAKEDTLLGFFLMLALYCFVEAKAAADGGRRRDQNRWEWAAAANVGLMFASKYFFHFALVPVVAYLWLRRSDTKWRVPLERWVALIGGAIVVFGLVNWTPFMPSSWQYGLDYMAEKKTVFGSLWFMGEIHNNLPSFLLAGTPPWFYVVFAAVKLAPPTFFLAVVGLALALKERRPGHVVLLSWMAVWFLVFSVSGAKWGRFFQTILPAFALLAGHAVERALAKIEALRAEGRLPAARYAGIAVAAALAGPLVVTEGVAAIEHAPRHRLYISVLGGGPENVQWFFPHCDYYDSGFREAIGYIAAHAEPEAELSSEIEWVSKYYTEVFRREDLVRTAPRKETACLNGRPCYVVIQAGRWYLLNRDLIAAVQHRRPWHVERIGGQDVVTVYRLEPGERLYPEVPGSSALDTRRL